VEAAVPVVIRLLRVALAALEAFLAAAAVAVPMRIMASIPVRAVPVLTATSACIAGKEAHP
jgi:hypothetical protein